MAAISKTLADKKAAEGQLVVVQQEKARLLAEMKTQKKNRFARDYAQYRQIAGTAELGAAVKMMAWKEICGKWTVEPGTQPGQLVWNDAEGKAELFVPPSLKVSCNVPGVEMVVAAIHDRGSSSGSSATG